MSRFNGVQTESFWFISTRIILSCCRLHSFTEITFYGHELFGRFGRRLRIVVFVVSFKAGTLIFKFADRQDVVIGLSYFGNSSNFCCSFSRLRIQYFFSLQVWCFHVLLEIKDQIMLICLPFLLGFGLELLLLIVSCTLLRFFWLLFF